MLKISAIVLVLVIENSKALPILDLMRSISENINFESFDNYLPKVGDLPKYEYSLNQKVESKTEAAPTTQNINFVGEIITRTVKDDRNIGLTKEIETNVSTEEIHKMIDNDLAGNTQFTTSSFIRDIGNRTHGISATKNFQNAKRLEDILTFLKANTPDTDTDTLGGIVQNVRENSTESNKEAQQIESTSIFIEEVSVTESTNDGAFTQLPSTTTATTLRNSSRNLDPVEDANMTDSDMATSSRPIRQDGSREEIDMNSQDDDEFGGRQSDESEEDMNQLTGLISAFLGGLSRPDGSIDVEAITGLLGSLSMQNDDGTYDFNGLTDLLMSFFGGGDEGGGSDIGAFLGGLLGAFIKGVAMPPGAKGAGVFAGKVLTGILPALSGPAPTEEGSTDKPAPPLDSGGFIGGLLSSILQSSGQMSNSNGGDKTGGGGGSKFPIFKAIFSMITSVFTSSSASH